MKKTIGIVLLLFMIFSVTACRPEPKVTYDENGIGFGGGKGVYWNTIIVYGLKFDASGESAEITIPEEYNGKPVLLIGDNHNDCRFVAYGDGVVDKLRWNPEDADETRVFELTLDIGKIVDICFSSNGPNTYFFKRSEDGKLILYKIHIHWICSEENEIYVSENGYLYKKWDYEKGNAVPLFDQYLNEIK